jgi:hypothetical protein
MNPARPALPRDMGPGAATILRVAMREISLCRILLYFDFENLRPLMSQIRSENGQALWHPASIEKSIHLPRRTVALVIYQAICQQSLIRQLLYGRLQVL